MRPNAEMSSCQATFDLKAAREAMARATERPNVTTDIYHLAALTYLPAALDEIERQRAREKEFVLASSKRTQFALDTAKFWIDQYERQAKRIAELEVDNQKWREYNQQLYRANRKKHAALKKLGQAKRERGKALVEERAKTACLLHPIRLCGLTKEDYQEAREQLRLEGKL